MSQLATKLQEDGTAKKIGKELGESKDTVYRYIRLTELIPELLKLVDEERIAFSPAVEISYLKEDEQYVLHNLIEYNDSTPSQSQAKYLKKLSQEGRLTTEKIEEIMGEIEDEYDAEDDEEEELMQEYLRKEKKDN